MSKVLAQVALTVFGVSLLVGLMGVGYLAQTFGPAQFNEPAPRRNQARSNYAYANDGPHYSNEPMERKPIPEGESVWEDYPAEDLKPKRLPDRPGNFEVITLVGQFYEGRYQVEPRYTGHAAFPLWLASDRFESDEEFQAKRQVDDETRRERGRKQKNKLRQYNVIISELKLQRFASGESAVTNPKENGVTQTDLETFAAVRKAHPERCYLVLVDVQLESLQSDKVEGGGAAAEILCYVHKADGWKLVWWRKG